MQRSYFRLLAVVLALAMLLVTSAAAAPGDLNPSDLDPSFGGGTGQVTFAPTKFDSSFAMALAPDGKIVTAGEVLINNNYVFEVARFLSDGNPDSSFNGTGLATADFSGSGHPRYSIAYAVLVQPDGKIVAGGHAYDPTEHDFGLARFTVEGALDTSFGPDHNGLVRTHFGDDPSPSDIHDNIVHNLGIQPDGKILAVGRVFDGTNYVTGFARYCPDGLLDNGKNCGTPGFGVDGKATILDNGFAASENPIAMYPDGSFVVGGNTGPDAPDSDFALYGVCTNGKLANGINCDWSFGTNGKVTTDIKARSFDEVIDLAIQGDGKILAAGWTDLNIVTSNTDYALVRYNLNGSLDTSFNGVGKVYLNVAGLRDDPVAVAVAPDNKIVMVGNDTDYWASTYSIVRFCANGKLDNGINCGPAAFGNLGIKRAIGFTSGDVTPVSSQATSISIQKDGRILVTGMSFSPLTSAIGVARYMAGSHLSFSGVSAGQPFLLGNAEAVIQLTQGGPCDFIIDRDNIFPRNLLVPGEMPIRWRLINANACSFNSTLTLSYTDQELAAGEVTDEAKLTAYYSNDGVVWAPAAATVANPAQNSVEVRGVNGPGYWSLGMRYDHHVLMPGIMK